MKTKSILFSAGLLLAAGLALIAGRYLGSRTDGANPWPTVVSLPERHPDKPAVKSPAAEINVGVFSAQETRESSPLALNTPDAVRRLLDQIASTPDWGTRAALSKQLRAVSEPSVLQVLLPALLETYGRGNTIFNEISDTVARLAQADTVETLEVMHWEASTEAGQGRKILRTVAAIRNPPAKRALAKLAAHAGNPALAACAEEALKAMAGQAGL